MDNRQTSDTPLYTISIAARLVRANDNNDEPMHPQTLRMYERLGLVTPKRMGRNRLYSDNDIARLRSIQHLTQEHGINLAGVTRVLEMEERIRQLEAKVAELMEHSKAAGGS